MLSNKVKQHLTNIFIQEWISHAAAVNNRKTEISYVAIYVTSKIKTTFNIRELFGVSIPFKKSFDYRLRISNHSVRVETGRFNLPPLPINEHKCFKFPVMTLSRMNFIFCLTARAIIS